MNYLIKNKNWDIIEDYNLDKLLYLLIDRPNCISNDIFIWDNKCGYYHRNYDLPSYAYKHSNCVCWFTRGLTHRSDDKPAKIWDTDFSKTKFEYWVNGEIIKSKTKYK